MADIEKLRKMIKDGSLTTVDIPLYYDVMVEIANNLDTFKDSVKDWNRTFFYATNSPADHWLKIENSMLSYGMGKPDKIDITYSVSEEKVIKILSGELEGGYLYITGDLKIEGDLGDAQKLVAAQGTVVMAMDLQPPVKEEELEGEPSKFLLTKEDNLKIQASNARKGPIIAEGLQTLGELTAKEHYCLGLRIEEFARDFPDKIALMFEDKKWTFTEFNEEINRYANFFLEKVGLKKGDIVVVDLENRPEILFMLVAMSKIGCIASLINTNLRENPLVHSIKHSTGTAFVIGEELCEAFEEILSKLELSEEQTKRLYFLKDRGEKPVPNNFIDLKQEIQNSSTNNPSTTPTIKPTDAFAFIFTSGTTGLPKAAIITNTHLLGGMGWFGFFVLEMKPEDVMFITTPFYHSTAILVAYGAALSQACTIVISQKFSVSKFWDLTRKYNVTCFNYVGEICRYLYNHPPKPDDADNPVVKVVGNGLRLDYWLDFKKRFGINWIGEFYGATEAGTPNFANVHNLDLTVGTCLTPYALVKWDVDKEEPELDDEGHMIRVKPGGVGLLLGQVLDQDSYYMYKDPEATRKKVFRNVFAEGDMFINTGDLLRDIGYGHAQFVDRLGDTFRWKGENVSTEEVESVVNNFEQVEMSCSYGVLIPETEGRAGMVSLVLRDERELNKQTFLKMLKDYLPEYAIPKFIRIRKEFEVTGTLKIRKIGMKKEGYDFNQINDPLYVLLPGTSEYIPLTKEKYEEIDQNKYKF